MPKPNQSSASQPSAGSVVNAHSGRRQARAPQSQFAPPKPIEIEWVSPAALKPNPTNPRKHSRQQIRKLERDIRKHGFINPLIITQDSEVIVGHGRLEAGKLAELSEIPVIRLALTKAEAKARNLWDNKSSDLSQFDPYRLGFALQELVELDYDIEETGFSVGETDQLIAALLGSEIEAADDVVPLPQKVAISQPGDLWIAGPHRICCGDAEDPASYAKLLDSELANAVFTDVPYNLTPQLISGNGRVRHGAFKMASGEMSPHRYREFLANATTLMVKHSKAGSLHFHCIDWRHVHDLQQAAGSNYKELVNLCVWVKPNGGMGSLYRSRHELVLVYKSGTARHRNNVDLGRNGRNRTNVWEYAGGTSFSGRVTDEGNLLNLHPTVKPVQMVVDAILDCTVPGDIVLDPFLGSGSSLIAAERSRRRCFGMDIDPVYVDIALRRWQQHSGSEAVLQQTGQPFHEVAAARTTSSTTDSKASDPFANGRQK